VSTRGTWQAEAHRDGVSKRDHAGGVRPRAEHVAVPQVQPHPLQSRREQQRSRDGGLPRGVMLRLRRGRRRRCDVHLLHRGRGRAGGGGGNHVTPPPLSPPLDRDAAGSRCSKRASSAARSAAQQGTAIRSRKSTTACGEARWEARNCQTHDPRRLKAWWPRDRAAQDFNAIGSCVCTSESAYTPKSRVPLFRASLWPGGG
jgi:hypothetical protein